MNQAQPYVPYCGTPPVPSEIWLRWNWDPLLLSALLLLLYVYFRRSYLRGSAPWDARPAAPGERSRFVQGWFALALGLISPLCNLSVALFSARVSQHMWLVLIAAPLLASGGVLRSFTGGRSAKFVEALSRPFAATILFAATLWLWHLPRTYQATFESDLVYWLMHITLTGSAVLLWRTLLLGDSRRFVGRLFAAFATLLQMGLLGALLTFAPRALYPAHWLTSQAWGLTPLEDQQLGGLIMWVPGGVALTILVLWMVMKILQQGSATTVHK